MFTYSQLVGGQNCRTLDEYIDGNLQIAEHHGVDDQVDYKRGNYDCWTYRRTPRRPTLPTRS